MNNYYIGDTTTGVYFHALRDTNSYFYVSARAKKTLDNRDPEFTEILEYDGPYPSRCDALRAGLRKTADWCIKEDITLSPHELLKVMDKILQALRP